MYILKFSFLLKTDQLSSMYYESRWELIVERSLDSQKNASIMKFVTLSIVTNRNHFNLTGLNFFNVSLNSVLTVSISRRIFTKFYSPENFSFVGFEGSWFLFYIFDFIALKRLYYYQIHSYTHMHAYIHAYTYIHKYIHTYVYTYAK